MPKRVPVRLIVEVDLDDPRAVSEAACAMYAAMDTEPPGGNPLRPRLERDLRQMPGLALEQLLDPRKLLTGVPGVTFVRAQAARLGGSPRCPTVDDMGRRYVDWLFRSRETGRITVAQVPNLPLALFGACRIAQAVISPLGTVRNVLHWAGSAALAWWALDEMFRGVNPFRRLLGAAVLGFLLL